MESHEEKLHLMIEKSKQKEAENQMKLKAKQLASRANQSTNIERAMNSLNPNAVSSESYQSSSSYPSSSYPSSYPQQQQQSPSIPEQQQQLPTAGRGMTLKTKNTTKDLLDQLGMLPQSKKQLAANNLIPAGPAIPSQPISIFIEEKVTANISKDGTFNSMTINGMLNITVNDSIALNSKVLLSREDKGFNFMVKPKIDKILFAQNNIVQMKNVKEPISAVGQMVSTIRWTKTFSDDSQAPLLVVVWPEADSSHSMKVSVEFTLPNEEYELHNVTIAIPTGTTEGPKINQLEAGSYHFISFFFFNFISKNIFVLDFFNFDFFVLRF